MCTLNLTLEWTQHISVVAIFTFNTVWQNALAVVLLHNLLWRTTILMWLCDMYFYSYRMINLPYTWKCQMGYLYIWPKATSPSSPADWKGVTRQISEYRKCFYCNWLGTWCQLTRRTPIYTSAKPKAMYTEIVVGQLGMSSAISH